ncbi:hypothetical protein B296_00054242 [Ensete ventricosum]|uniref:Uncharacterized protein n=1 Tax=Ensete ventricosum TaxID=4639 RepID=A0A426Y4Q6_ENSVE|nr:hypothetical protein B296_00054242 [Ensete ventricosum]
MLCCGGVEEEFFGPPASQHAAPPNRAAPGTIAPFFYPLIHIIGRLFRFLLSSEEHIFKCHSVLSWNFTHYNILVFCFIFPHI